MATGLITVQGKVLQALDVLLVCRDNKALQPPVHQDGVQDEDQKVVVTV
jgi:hypothetical protein